MIQTTNSICTLYSLQIFKDLENGGGGAGGRFHDALCQTHVRNLVLETFLSSFKDTWLKIGMSVTNFMKSSEKKVPALCHTPGVWSDGQRTSPRTTASSRFCVSFWSKWSQDYST